MSKIQKTKIRSLIRVCKNYVHKKFVELPKYKMCAAIPKKKKKPFKVGKIFVGIVGERTKRKKMKENNGFIPTERLDRVQYIHTVVERFFFF